MAIEFAVLKKKDVESRESFIQSSVVQRLPMPTRPIWFRPTSPNQSPSTG